ncbi:MAG: hypothetical protein ABI616_15060 [Pseudomonadota bacterium]
MTIRMHLVGAFGMILCTALAIPLAICAAAAPAAMSCLASGDGALQARVRGAIDADINWTNDQMSCEGSMRPDRKGIRVTLAGPLTVTAGGKPSQQPLLLRFVFGISMKDMAAGVAQALPTNLTVILEGQQQLFATRGDNKCAVEQIEVTPLLARASQGSGAPGAPRAARQRVHVRGYCTGPASDLQGLQRVLVSTFDFTSQINSGEDP